MIIRFCPSREMPVHVIRWCEENSLAEPCDALYRDLSFFISTRTHLLNGKQHYSFVPTLGTDLFCITASGSPMETQDSIDIRALQQLILGPIPVCETFRFPRLGGAAALCLVVGL